MCGIVGIVKLNPLETVDEECLKRMRDVLQHRGPDDKGLVIDGPVGLGHRRLAIVDVRGGHQPMANEDGTVWIVFNGEIYNHAELRPRLEACGHRYRTRSDTETILHLYEEDGERCVERLQGMFAFALWDRKRGRLLLARDRLGIKPLYYAWTDHELVFGSEIKAILAGGSVRPALNEAIVPEFLATGFVAGEKTFFRRVRKLLLGRTFSWSCADGPRQRRYWRLPVTTDDGAPGTLEDCGRKVRARLANAVRSHLMSDVPLGLFLSDGMDSSGLAALMAPMVKEPIRTFAVGFSDPEANELASARLAARTIRECTSTAQCSSGFADCPSWTIGTELIRDDEQPASVQRRPSDSPRAAMMSWRNASSRSRCRTTQASPYVITPTLIWAANRRLGVHSLGLSTATARTAPAIKTEPLRAGQSARKYARGDSAILEKVRQ